MGLQVFAGVCILICLVVIYFAWKIYKDTRQLKKKAEDEEEKIDFS